MNTLGLHPLYKPKDPVRRYKGIAIVIVLHVVIGWGIVSGTARNALVAMKKPLEAVVIQEVVIPPPPPPPPPKEIKPPQEAPRAQAPPPPFVPPPEVAAPETPAPAMVSAPTPPPALPDIRPPALPAPSAPVKSAPSRTDLHVVCPTQVQPEMPRKASQDGIDGIVKASALIKDGVVKEITILSGPRVFHAAVKAAMMQYKCSADSGEVVGTQEFVFKLE